MGIAGERRVQVRQKVGRGASAWRMIAIALMVLLGCELECSGASAPQNKTITSPPPPWVFEAAEQEQARSQSSRETEVRERARTSVSTDPTSSKSRTAPQNGPGPPTQTTSPGPAKTLPSAQTEAVFPSLPAASRARMRNCGREWQEMKRTGRAKELTWRDFATQCLTQ